MSVMLFFPKNDCFEKVMLYWEALFIFKVGFMYIFLLLYHSLRGQSMISYYVKIEYKENFNTNLFYLFLLNVYFCCFKE